MSTNAEQLRNNYKNFIFDCYNKETYNTRNVAFDVSGPTGS